MTCRKCSRSLAEDEALDGPDGRYCAACFCELARSPKKLSPDERARLKKAVKEEMAGVLPREALREILDECIKSVLIAKEDYDEVENRTLNKIEQAAGLTMCEEILGVIGALQATLREQEATIREKIKKLSGL